MISIQDYPVTPVASKIDITYTPDEEAGSCGVLVRFYDTNEFEISHSHTTLTGAQLQDVLDGNTDAADAFILQRFGIERL